MNKKITSLFVILLIVTFTTSAYAAITTIVYQSGPNLVKSTEYYQYKYVGYIQLTSAYNDNGWSRLRGYIRYYIPNISENNNCLASTFIGFLPFIFEVFSKGIYQKADP